MRINITKDGLKNSSCAPIEMNASAIPPRPMSSPPIPTQKKPFGAPLAKNGPRKTTSPAAPWKSGTAIFFSASIPPMLVMAIARMPMVTNHLKYFFHEGKYSSARPMEMPSGIRLATVST
ncbi:MAG: hypothetical protein PGMFKBFP_00588 [Anaerolineales bacterium]|nr:hypothetical protein [Anaerolineales bacterium]